MVEVVNGAWNTEIESEIEINKKDPEHKYTIDKIIKYIQNMKI